VLQTDFVVSGLRENTRIMYKLEIIFSKLFFFRLNVGDGEFFVMKAEDDI